MSSGQFYCYLYFKQRSYGERYYHTSHAVNINGNSTNSKQNQAIGQLVYMFCYEKARAKSTRSANSRRIKELNAPDTEGGQALCWEDRGSFQSISLSPWLNW